ncbi:rod shape-determining protein MreD [Curvibacter sp. RS43]|uniref:Rod shape-determining protein MreD n=1 Tax=Curvibacter microcysteis TaxID=3026419 RepID=A0ABT5MCU4_9BURK|nr:MULTISPECIES: rod shape-determining protein MreD [unclassified Curvibacter]MDD0811245.1 rod shape-determining protein MreD [Curvibacter sp. RS43]MDD0813784.1 rod shape-determining protein MreD [Curvibacter sp. HBC28]
MIGKASGQQLLLPANPVFIWGSLLVALMVNMLPLGRMPGMPDVLLVLMMFWSVHQPARVGIGAAFVFGLIMDVHQSALLGQHALAYCGMSFLFLMMQRRLLWFSVASQTLQVLPLFLAAHVLEVLLRVALGGIFPGFWFLLAAGLEVALWPLVSWVLLAPQRRPPDRDENRPL